MPDTWQILRARIADRFRQNAAAQSLRRALGVAGTVLIGGALMWAPVAAFNDGMVTVTKAALAGIVLLIIMKLLPRMGETLEQRPGSLDDER